jgi:hypothetical protein
MKQVARLDEVAQSRAFASSRYPKAMMELLNRSLCALATSHLPASSAQPLPSDLLSRCGAG